LVSPGKETSLIIRKMRICEWMNFIWLREGIVSEILDSSTRLVLVNAIYYKNFWKTAFSEKYTENRPFNINANTVKNVPTMHLTTTLLTGYSKNLECRWLQLPFEVCTILEQVQSNIIDYRSSIELHPQILVIKSDALLIKQHMTFRS
jgi:hypothetical protein